MSTFLPGLGTIVPLFLLRGANFQLTTDQALSKVGAFTNYYVRVIIARRLTGAASVACLGGIYPAAAKAGTPIVAAAQSWLGLSGAGKIVVAALEAILATDVQTATPILSLSTGSTGAVTGDVYIFGYPLD